MLIKSVAAAFILLIYFSKAETQMHRPKPNVILLNKLGSGSRELKETERERGFMRLDCSRLQTLDQTATKKA